MSSAAEYGSLRRAMRSTRAELAAPGSPRRLGSAAISSRSASRGHAGDRVPACSERPIVSSSSGRRRRSSPGLQDRRTPAPSQGCSADRLHAAAVRSAPSRSALLTTKMSAISMMPALSACTSSPVPGTSTTIETSAVRTMSTSSCPTPTVSMMTMSRAGRVEHERRVAGRAGQAAEVAARRHAADEHARIAGVRLHADAVAEDGAAGERAGRIHRHDADGAGRPRAARAVSRSTSVLLPAPGGPVTPTRYARPVCGNSRETSARGRVATRLRSSGDRARDGAHVAREHALGQAGAAVVVPIRRGAAGRSPAAGSRSCLRRWS